MITLTKLTKQLVLLSFLCVLCGVSAVVYFLLDIRVDGSRLEETLRSAAQEKVRAQEMIRYGQLLEQTKENRSRLASAFLTSENEGIQLLNAIEAEAPKAGLRMTDSFIERVADPQKPEHSEIVMRFAYSGSKGAVYNFTRLFETMPMHSRVQKLQLEQEGDVWRASIEVHITIRTS